jgi:hypothetical protein
MKKTLLISIFTLITTFALVSCGGGGGGSSSSSSNATPAPVSAGVSGTYTASAAAGEVLSYTVDTEKLTYSYTILYSAYGLEGKTGGGTLTKNSDGSFAPSESPNSKVYALPNGLLMGAVKMTIQGNVVHVPILGVQNPITSLAGLAGTYNYISNTCNAKAFGNPTYNGCGTNYGTLKITATGSYFQCTQANITSSASCFNLGAGRGSQGTLTAIGSGLFKYSKAGTTTPNYFLAFTASNGENVVIGDLNDPVEYGYGQFIGSTQPSANLTQEQWSTQAKGTWYYHDIYADASRPNASAVLSSGAHVVSSSGGFTNPDGTSGTVQINSPWTGFVSTSQAGRSGAITGTSLLAGTGVYVWRNNGAQVYGYQVGVHE